jgi:hypothetical protein
MEDVCSTFIFDETVRSGNYGVRAFMFVFAWVLSAWSIIRNIYMYWWM